MHHRLAMITSPGTGSNPPGRSAVGISTPCFVRAAPISWGATAAHPHVAVEQRMKRRMLHDIGQSTRTPTRQQKLRIWGATNFDYGGGGATATATVASIMVDRPLGEDKDVPSPIKQVKEEGLSVPKLRYRQRLQEKEKPPSATGL